MKDPDVSQPQPAAAYQANDGAAYDRFIGRWTRRLAVEVADHCPPILPGPCLDVGCGTGSMALALANRYPDRKIVGIDRSAAYLEVARSLLPGAEFHEQDANALDLADKTFSASYAVLLLNFLPDPAIALNEMIRVTLPGGLVVAASWDFRGGLVYQRLLWDSAAAIDPQAAATRARLFSHPLAKPDGMTDLFRACGLDDVTRTGVTIRMDFADFDDYWQPLLGGQGPVGSYVAALDPAMRERVADAVRLAYLSGDEDGPRSLAASAWIVSGTVPATERKD
jgi:trans-aconitate methyltransferase